MVNNICSILNPKDNILSYTNSEALMHVTNMEGLETYSVLVEYEVISFADVLVSGIYQAGSKNYLNFKLFSFRTKLLTHH